jgi:rare lipoprotein A
MFVNDRDQFYRPIVVALRRHSRYLPTQNNRRIDNGSNFRGRVTMGVGPLKLKLTFLLLAAAGALVATNNPSLAAKSGVASSYSTKEGLKTASGARLSDHALTAAHRSLPFGSKVRVTNRRNGRTIVVTINDRGPFIRGRIIDLTPAGARALGFSGLTQVTIERTG